MAHTDRVERSVRVSPSSLSFFSEDEKNHLALAARKAKEFDNSDDPQLRTIFEGQLYKYTNVVKGWQYRYFVLNPELGTLEYYMVEEVKKTRPRGAMHLAGALISPSEEDGQMFTVSASCGEIYKLRAHDAKERQLWMNRLRSTAQNHGESIAAKNPPLMISTGGKENCAPPQPVGVLPHPSQALAALQQKLSEANLAFRDLAIAIETLPNSMQIKPHDPDLLLLKATSTATVVCLEQCFSVLNEKQHETRLNHTHSQRKHHSKKLKKKVRDWAHQPFRPVVQQQSLPVSAVDYRTSSNQSSSVRHYNSDSTLTSMHTARSSETGGEVSDYEDEWRSGEAFPSTSDKEAVLSLLGQLKMGTDLTKVTLPIFVQEPKSLLELYADLFSYTKLFVSISEKVREEDRMLSVVQWLLSALYATRRSMLVRKPLNPVMGESFRCSFKTSSTDNSTGNDNGNSTSRVTFVGEQVSHHPPKSAFYVECMENNMKAQASVHVKASFMNMFVRVDFIGSLCLELLSLGEKYVISLPQMACRSLVSKPYLEFNGRMKVKCVSTGCSALINFPSKPFHGAKVHGVLCELRNRENNIFLKGQGSWDGSVTFYNPEEGENAASARDFDVRTESRSRKRVRPISEQDMNESRRVWQQVSRDIKAGDYVGASGHKFQIEESHRHTGSANNNKKNPEPKLFKHSGVLSNKSSSLSSICEWTYKHALPSEAPS